MQFQSGVFVEFASVTGVLGAGEEVALPGLDAHMRTAAKHRQAQRQSEYSDHDMSFRM